MQDKKLYAQRDIELQCNYYTRHVMAMTAEGLHSKSDIAAELAHRDIQLEAAETLAEAMDNWCAVGVGEGEGDAISATLAMTEALANWNMKGDE